MDKNDKSLDSLRGDSAELHASAWLVDRGWLVFKNVGGSGYVDMIALKDGETKKIDVKTKGARSGRARTAQQIEDGVVFLNYIPETHECYFVEHGY